MLPKPPTMKSILVCIFCALSFLPVSAQPSVKDKKYPSLLWEISGNGLKKPSYLIGTMHVSSKIAFNLPDSFYHAIRSAQVVALETNPETWQEDMSKYDFGNDRNSYSKYSSTQSIPSDYLTINTLKFYKYDNKIRRSLFSNPSTINNLLYRSYGNNSSDFEEDTYLDMYIFQVGKKWGKKVAGVEDYGKSMKLMAEAYQDAAKEKNRKERSYSDFDEEYSADKLQEAYGSGNLDLLDSINKYNSFSAAFDEKFLYRRNDIQAASMDSIMQSGTILFVGVGAAHLPGDRGVIEILRRQGYKVRPVKMGARANREKELVDKIRVPVVFRKEVAEDGMYKVNIPGKFFKFGEDPALDQRQYADMANGSYYMVTRIMTNAWMWAHNTESVYRAIDSLLYENIPGKIISRVPVTKNGYKGLDITNRTRRGDIQRYNIFVTPFEILFFKMSGTGDYVRSGEEAKNFFGSIELKEVKNISPPSSGSMKKYSPVHGGFAIDFPHEPFVGNDGSWIYDAEDRNSQTHYRLVKSAIHNYGFVEEDTFDLCLMDESFMASEFIDSQISRKQIVYKGYPALDCKYRDKDGFVYSTRFLIQGPNYYSIIAHSKAEDPAHSRFLNSFEIKPFVYGVSKQEKDTSLYFTVNTPVFPSSNKIQLDIPSYTYQAEEEVESEDDLLDAGAYRNKVITHDTTGEKVYITFYRSPRYYYAKDSSALEKDYGLSFLSDSNWIVRKKTSLVKADKTRVWEMMISDTGSSRMLWTKVYYKDGVGFSLLTQGDTLTAPSAFISNFLETFSPADTLKGVDPFTKKSKLFFDDLNNGDSVLHKRAVKYINDIKLDSTDVPDLQNAIASLNWNEKGYLDIKSSLINKLGDIPSSAASKYLQKLYYSLDDTIQLQYAVLESLLQQHTQGSFYIFRDIINNEAPVLSYNNSNYNYYTGESARSGSVDGGNFLDELSDSLLLTKSILPDLLLLLNLEDYKPGLMKLLGELIDSNMVKPVEYESYFAKFLIEAKQELRKQSVSEKRKSIAKAEEIKNEKKSSVYREAEDEKDSGNEDLNLYATLLLPFWNTHSGVQPLIGQMLRSNDNRLKYNTVMLLIDKNKPVPDTMMNYFAGLNDYRYELYTDLKSRNKSDLFPKNFNTPILLGISSLLYNQTYEKPDTIEYIDRMATTFKHKKGFIYFFRYKVKKDDLGWKLATVGLVPADTSLFEFRDSLQTFKGYDGSIYKSRFNQYDFTSLTDTKIREDKPLGDLLKKELKKMLYSRRNSAREFYGEDTDRSVMYSE